MTLKDKLTARITGNAAEKVRRELILAELLKAFEGGGEEAVSRLLQAKMAELERSFGKCLAGLEKKLY
jgi:hypothetical protein